MYITQCPNCQTRFKVQPGQLDVCDGQVRCGRCATVFDARASLEPVNEPAPAKPAAAAPSAPAALADDNLPAEAGHLVRALANAPQNGQWSAPSPQDEATAIPLPADGDLDRISKNIDLELPDFAADAGSAGKAVRQEPVLRPDPLPKPVATAAAKPASPPPAARPAAKQPEVIPDDEGEDDTFLKKLEAARHQQTAPADKPAPAKADTPPAGGKRIEPSFKAEVLPDDEDDGVVYKGNPLAADPTVEPAPFIAHSAELLKGGAPATEDKKGFALPKVTLPKLPAFSLPALPEFSFSAGGKLVWLWTAAAVVAAIVLLVQVVYVYRTPIAAELPGSRGVLESMCKGLGCDVPLPRRSEQLRTEYSELAAVPDQPNLIRVSATVRNQAAYPQAYPHLELTLKDGEDRVLSRKVFAPKDYLSKNDFALGQFNGNSEIKVNMQLDIGLLRASGYSLMWFYP
ncbi:DUF3426 domain-containing protein [Rivihabitans pingtungensis]|uniref:Putative Zn finger-like uncharacterized protein n=1 Tax=Rivihabitans pingtungensis TaxID=1054498 RepID=A0A318KJR5_9NEIS|nr:DUF3426 domain-containing protein [Rivihabitans pingtungensis]PXX78344.1 putative Zn finger-like uncharacterized protein [Rivihabitans pingtungensis]